MKTLLFALLCGVALTVQAQQTTAVNKWVSPVFNDFVSLPENQYADAQLESWGYTRKTYQFNALADDPGHDDGIAVNRWTMPNCKESILLAEHEHTDAQLESWGYRDKLFQFYAYRRIPAGESRANYLAVYRWVNALPEGNGCRDFTLTTVEGEYTDGQLRGWGYSGKRLQFFVPKRSSGTGRRDF
ncbi:MAG: hypothetical protein H7Y12_14585 [Sphingobacteriaceae bacterium]|nr:hypothetical protein [Cytophagaceae bacterium]